MLSLERLEAIRIITKQLAYVFHFRVIILVKILWIRVIIEIIRNGCTGLDQQVRAGLTCTTIFF